MSTQKFIQLPLNKVTIKRGKQERSFELPVPIVVSGVDAKGNSFQEQTILSSISSFQATFELNSGVTIGSKIDLCLDIPKTLILENRLKLALTGAVIFVKVAANNNKKQQISVRLDKKYKIHPSSPKTN
ncbi:MAG: hypothetical protein ACETWK_13880 [Candidatus Aminicenantaceae bacterium]